MIRLLFLMLVVISGMAKQRICAEYLPILEEGKVWVLEPENCLYPEYFPYFVRATVVGDTVIEDKEAWIVEKLSLYSTKEETVRKYLLEEARKLYFLTPDSVWSPLLDFNPSVGQSTMAAVCDGQPTSGWTVREEGMVFLEDGFHRYLKMPQLDYWIEGVGSVYQNYLTTSSDPIPTGGSVFPVLTRCFRNGWTVFDKTQFEYFSGIDEVIGSSDLTPSTLYDLHGRRVDATVPGSVYIRNGKKFVAK